MHIPAFQGLPGDDLRHHTMGWFIVVRIKDAAKGSVSLLKGQLAVALRSMNLLVSKSFLPRKDWARLIKIWDLIRNSPCSGVEIFSASVR